MTQKQAVEMVIKMIRKEAREIRGVGSVYHDAENLVSKLEITDGSDWPENKEKI